MTKELTAVSNFDPGSSLSQSYAPCRAVTRAANSSVALAFSLLPPAKRRAMDAL